MPNPLDGFEITATLAKVAAEIAQKPWRRIDEGEFLATQDGTAQVICTTQDEIRSEHLLFVQQTLWLEYPPRVLQGKKVGLRPRFAWTRMMGRNWDMEEWSRATLVRKMREIDHNLNFFIEELP